MKILQVVKTNEGALWAFNQAQWLFDNGVNIITILPSKEGGKAEKYKSRGMCVIEGDFTLPVLRPWIIFDKIKRINKIINDIQPDIIHCHFVTNIIMLRIALKKSKIPRLFQVPGPLHLESWFYRKLEILFSNNNDYWAGSCKKTCDIYIKSGIPNNKVYLAYYGGFLRDEYPNSQNKLHKEYGISQDKILIGMVSYFYKPKVHLLQFKGLKGHEDFINAIALAREKNPLIIGVIVGDAWGNAHKYVDKIKKFANKNCKEGIIFTGFRNDVKEIYKEFAIAVHPSHSENLGGAAGSLAAGIPTISTNVGGFPDIVINGVTGYTVPPKSPKQLSEAIIKMLENKNEAKAMAREGKQLVKKILDIEVTGAAILNIYKSILDRNNKL